MAKAEPPAIAAQLDELKGDLLIARQYINGTLDLRYTRVISMILSGFDRCAAESIEHSARLPNRVGAQVNAQFTQRVHRIRDHLNLLNELTQHASGERVEGGEVLYEFVCVLAGALDAVAFVRQCTILSRVPGTDEDIDHYMVPNPFIWVKSLFGLDPPGDLWTLFDVSRAYGGADGAFERPSVAQRNEQKYTAIKIIILEFLFTSAQASQDEEMKEWIKDLFEEALSRMYPRASKSVDWFYNHATL